MKKPLILLTARSHVYFNSRVFSDNDSYFAYVQAGGGLPLLGAAFTEEEADLYTEAMDGLLITGGDDIDPSRYNEPNTHSELMDADLEESDFLLYEAFKKAGKPILGICRGFQVIAVAEGSKLIQDIPSLGIYHEHNQRKMEPALPSNETAHMASFIPGTQLHSFFGDAYPVNTFHHQGITEAPEGFTLSARSDDGLAEGIEKDCILAVQWHPERLLHDAKHRAIVEAFVRKCSL